MGPTLLTLSSDDQDLGPAGEVGGAPRKTIGIMQSDNRLEETDEKTRQDSERFSEMSKVIKPGCDGIGFARFPSTIQTLGCVFIYACNEGAVARDAQMSTHLG